MSSRRSELPENLNCIAHVRAATARWPALSFPACIGDLDVANCGLQVRLQLQSFGFTKGKATQVPVYKGTPLHVLATIIRNEGITGPFKVLHPLCCSLFVRSCSLGTNAATCDIHRQFMHP